MTLMHFLKIIMVEFKPIILGQHPSLRCCCCKTSATFSHQMAALSSLQIIPISAEQI